MDRFGRIRRSPAKELRDLEDQHIGTSAKLYKFQHTIHEAHVVMLYETGILKKEEASRILKGLSKVKKAVEKDPRLSRYMLTEARLISEIGALGGKMHIGRSRNDLNSTTLRMCVRDRVITLIDHLIDLWSALLDKAERNIGTIMPGYTHWQQAQPITFGHYLSAHADGCERILESLEFCYQLTNSSSLGAGALAGTSWPIDRDMTARLLGFSRVLENTLDCVATRDFVVIASSAMTLLLSNLSRMAEDLQIWSSVEFSFIDLDERYAGTSSIMPQKKNPVVLEHVKAHAASAIGHLVGILTALKGASYTNTRDLNELPDLFNHLADDALTAVDVAWGTVSTMTPNKDIMALEAARGFLTMTELADVLVREADISFRIAHEIVASLVNSLVEQRKAPTSITSDDIARESLKIAGKTIRIRNEKIRSVLDPKRNVILKHSGGPAPTEVRRMIRSRRQKARKSRLRQDGRKRDLAVSQSMLEEAVRGIVN